MLLLNKILTLLLIIIGGQGNIAALQSDKTSMGMSTLIFESISSSNLFYIDDSLYSRQNTDTLSVNSGYHSLRASNSESDLWIEIDWSWDGELKADSTYYFEVSTKRFIVLNSVPYGADVIINGEFVGTTPYVLKSTTNAVELIKSNYMPVRIEPEEMIQKALLTINLILESPVIETEVTQYHTFMSYNRNKLISRSTYIITAISGVATVYFKFEADKAFNELEDAVDPFDRQYLSDRINRYDNLAAISFGTFQAGFLYSIYRAIRHR